MLSGLYSKWMYAWETALTTRDTNRIVRPLEWGFDWLADFTPLARNVPESLTTEAAIERMIAINDEIIRRSDDFYGYKTPSDFVLEDRYPELFPTNNRPETLRRDAEIRRRNAEGRNQHAQFLRFTSPVRTPYAENDIVNARWYPAPKEKQTGKPKQAIIVMPQWNADSFSHNILCALFNRFGISALRLSKPYHDIRRPAELERSDYAVSANIGRTTAACRQAVADIRSCLDWLEQQGYEQFGVLGTSLGSCYAFIASSHDARLRVNVFNHAAAWFGDVVWSGQSTRHVHAAVEQAGITQDQLRALWAGISPMAYCDLPLAESRANWPRKSSRVIYAKYDLTFPREFSLQAIQEFERLCNEYGLVDFDCKVLPCGHYTTGEKPFVYLDGWYLGAFVYQAFKKLAAEHALQDQSRQSATAAPAR
jgi:dienelactone hydrolase